jgi:peroxiredoxin
MTPGRGAGLLATVGLVAAAAARAGAQEPVRAYPMGDPRVGHDAPAFTAPYARAEGPGPADQPFALRAELGRVVILAFGRESGDSATVTLLRGLAARHAGLSQGDAVVAVVLPARGERLREIAARLALPYKVVGDPGGRIRRLFGVDRRELGVYVVDTSGRVAWRSLRFDPYSATSYEALGDAVRGAWPRVGSR